MKTILIKRKKYKVLIYLGLTFLLLLLMKQILLSKSVQKSNYRQEKISLFQTLPFMTTEVIFVGDSLTDNAEWHELFPGKQIANRGIQGDTTQGLLNRVAGITKTKAKKVFLMIGINDLIRNNSNDSVLKSYRAILQQLSCNHHHVYVQSILFVRNQEIEINNKIISMNENLKALSHQFENITFIDLNQSLASNNELKSEYTIDGIHLNGLGYKKWKEVVEHYVYY